jgi:hypothetical protein
MALNNEAFCADFSLMEDEVDSKDKEYLKPPLKLNPHLNQALAPSRINLPNYKFNAIFGLFILSLVMLLSTII